MTRKSWLAMTGMCVLLGTAAAQAYPITFDAGTPRTSTRCWQEADGDASTALSTGSNCLPQKRAGRDSRQPLKVTSGRAADLIQFDVTQLAGSPWASAFSTTGSLLSLTPVLTISHPQAPQLLTQISAVGAIGRISITGNAGRSIGNGTRHNPATTTTPSVPEPETLALMMMGLIGVAVATRGRRRTTMALSG